MSRDFTEASGHDEETKRVAHILRPRQGMRLIVFWPGGTLGLPIAQLAAIVVGRSSACDVAIDDPSISRRHLLVRAGPPVTVEDLGSMNATTIRSERLRPGHPVPLTV